MIGGDVATRARAFDEEAAEKFENLAERLLGNFEENGQRPEGLKGLANLLLKKLRSADEESVAHCHGLETVMRGVSRAFDHPEDLHCITDNIRRGLDRLKNSKLGESGADSNLMSPFD
jgi:hypothetical protein